MKSISAMVVAFCCCVAASGAARAQDNAEERALRRVEAELCDAFRAGDAKTIERIEDERYTLTDSHGRVTGRDSDIAEAKKGEPRYSEFRNHGQAFRFYGDTAIVNGITSVKGSSNGKPFAADFQFTDTWIKRGGEWKIAASHANRIGQPAKTD